MAQEKYIGLHSVLQSIPNFPRNTTMHPHVHLQA